MPVREVILCRTWGLINEEMRLGWGRTMCGFSPNPCGLKFQRTLSYPMLNKNMRGFSKIPTKQCMFSLEKSNNSSSTMWYWLPGISAQILTKPSWFPILQCYPEIPELMQNIVMFIRSSFGSDIWLAVLITSSRGCTSVRWFFPVHAPNPPTT